MRFNCCDNYAGQFVLSLRVPRPALSAGRLSVSAMQIPRRRAHVTRSAGPSDPVSHRVPFMNVLISRAIQHFACLAELFQKREVRGLRSSEFSLAVPLGRANKRTIKTQGSFFAKKAALSDSHLVKVVLLFKKKRAWPGCWAQVELRFRQLEVSNYPMSKRDRSV